MRLVLFHHCCCFQVWFVVVNLEWSFVVFADVMWRYFRGGIVVVFVEMMWRRFHGEFPDCVSLSRGVFLVEGLSCLLL